MEFIIHQKTFDLRTLLIASFMLFVESLPNIVPFVSMFLISSYNIIYIEK